MKINLKNAVEHFYPNASFVQIFHEAVANALDAGADEISIAISIEGFDKSNTLAIKISDNGHGFTDADFERFTSLLEAENPLHKGLGRLVYLAYFRTVTVSSTFDRTSQRDFVFDKHFHGKSRVSTVDARPSGSTLAFDSFAGERVKSYDYLIPEKIKDSLIQHFLPLLFTRKNASKPLTIRISLATDTPNMAYGFESGTATLTLDDVPTFKTASFAEKSLDFFEGFTIHYEIQRNPERPKSVTTAVCVDDRTVAYDLMDPESIPGAHQMTFLFASNYFIGKANTSRQRLQLPENVSETHLKRVLRREMATIIEREVPAVREHNDQTAASLAATYPHLSGYITHDTPGLIIRNDVLDAAQRRFFDDQRQILECTELDEQQYEKALSISSRVLMEYILYRAQIIRRLATVTRDNPESDIHDIILPPRRSYTQDTFIQDIYSNNVWLLDDRYMTYGTILSDEELSRLIHVIAAEEVTDDSRPDIALVFSADPAIAEKTDVVIVELKKRGLPLAKCEEVVSQLKQRARRLLRYYPNKINRLWFYGVTDIDAEFRMSLKESRFKELYSKGQVFHTAQDVIFDESQPPFVVDLFVMDVSALICDADARNATFLNLLRNSIHDSTRMEDQGPQTRDD